MTVMLAAALVLVAVALLPAMFRMATGPTDADRGVAADLVFFSFIGLVGIFGLLFLEAAVVLDVVLVATVVGFLATLSIARLVTRGQR